MRALSTAELLSAWEASAPLPPHQRALALLSVALADGNAAPVCDLAELSIGQRDAYLLTLREQTFGSRLQSLTVCPSCGERLEFELAIPDLRVESPVDSLEPFEIEEQGY